MTTTIIGFDSAWTDNPRAPGAICAVHVDGESAAFMPPRLVSFAQALEFIATEQRRSNKTIVAIDRLTIVPNTTGSRPVDKVAGSLISWVGGGVQPANRTKATMFGDAAPIWRFKTALGAAEDPERSRDAPTGLFLMEVFPALALPSFAPSHCGRLQGARYNPERRRTFRLNDWQSVVSAAGAHALKSGAPQIDAWCMAHHSISRPTKTDQDLLDAVLCALVGLQWTFGIRSEMAMIGDLTTGYMVTPAAGVARERLLNAAHLRGVAFS